MQYGVLGVTGAYLLGASFGEPRGFIEADLDHNITNYLACNYASPEFGFMLPKRAK